MRRCPECMKLIESTILTGPLVWGKQSVVFDDQGRPKSVGAIVPQAVVKSGEELKSKQLRMQCPHCQFEGNFAEFKAVRVCPFTGKEADVPVGRNGNFLVYLHSSVEEKITAMVLEAIDTLEAKPDTLGLGDLLVDEVWR